MKQFLYRFKNSGDPVLFAIFCLVLTSIYSILYNTQLFRNQYPGEYFTMLFLLSVARDAVIWYIALINRWVFIVFSVFMFAFGAGLNYFVCTAGIGIGIGAFELLFQTNIQEAAGVITKPFIIEIIKGVLISSAFIVVRFYIGGLKQKKCMAFLFIIFIIPVLIGRSADKDLKDVKYGRGGNTERGVHIMPEKIAENLYHYFRNQYRINRLFKERKNTSIPLVSASPESPDIVVFILTDALRPDHMQINGYERHTTPNMAREGFISFNDMYACETSTTRSVPCLMTRASRKENRFKYIKEPSVLAMYKAAGYDTAWISSQGSISTSDTGPAIVAKDADFVFFNDRVNNSRTAVYDSDLLPILDEFLEREGSRKAIVLHLSGSHWDYSKRYTDNQRIWTPECTKWIYDCSLEEVINSYDNTIIATDDFVESVINRIKYKKSLLFFSSDHGQFLGEEGRRIHSHELLQYKALGVVPFALWLSDSMKEESGILKIAEENKNKITSHDSIFHSITQCGNLKSDIIDDSLSICSDKLINIEKEYE